MVRLHPPEVTSELRGVLFDVDGTLYHQGCLRLIVGANLALAALLHPVRTLREIRILVHYRHAQEWLRLNQNNDITADSQLNRAVATTGVPAQEIMDCVHFWMEQLPLRYLPLCARRKMRRLINRWHSLGVPMGIYSDYPARDKLRVLGLGSLLPFEVCSTDPEVRAFKPDPRGFKAAAAKMGLSPPNIVYVGDRKDIDTAGALNSGMDAVLLVGKSFRGSYMDRGNSNTLAALDVELSEAYTARVRKPCWICGSSSTRKFRASTIRQEIDSRSVRPTNSDYGQTAALSECRHCSFIFADPMPHPAMIDLYRDMDDNAYQASSSARRLRMRRLLGSVLSYHPQARSLLDVGASTGLLVAEALARGLHADGVEPSRWCVETAAKVNDMRLYCGTLQECSNRLGEYDLVTLIDVVEHTDDPLSLIQQAASRLSPSGLLVIVTPDIGSLAARLIGRRWWQHRVDHVCYFNLQSMHRALKESGLKLVFECFTGWRFQITYICERLEQYMSYPPISTALRWLARSGRLTRYEININLCDSRMFIAKKEG